jgi:mono/diheme cytochrome c family protein
MKTILIIALITITGWTARGDGPESQIEHGKKLVEQKKCSLCHAVDGKGGKLGKPMNGIAAGKTDDFLKGVLLDPKKTISADVKMPAYKLSEDEVTAVIAYIKSLKTPENPKP